MNSLMSVINTMVYRNATEYETWGISTFECTRQNSVGEPTLILLKGGRRHSADSTTAQEQTMNALRITSFYNAACKYIGHQLDFLHRPRLRQVYP